MCLAHLGVAVALIGMASDSAFTREKLTTALPGERVEIGPWLVEMRSIMPVAGPNWTALETELRASRGGGVSILKPQSRYFTEPATTTSEAAIETDWNGQLYAVLGAQDVATGRWQLRLWWKPFVTLIWFGGVLIALGGLLALVGRWWRGVRTRRRLVGGRMVSRARFIPLIVFALIVVAVAWRLATPRDDRVASKLEGQRCPPSRCPPRSPASPGWPRPTSPRGAPRLVNIFASWCVPCAAEAPVLLDLERRGVKIDAIAIRDRPEDVAAFLARHGDPFERIGSDAAARSRSHWARRACPKASSSTAAASSAPSTSARSWSRTSRASCRRWRRRSEARLACPPAGRRAAPRRQRPAARALGQRAIARPRQEAAATALMQELRCLVCQGQSIADSDAELAGDMRALVRERIARGERPEAVRRWLVERYGAWVSYRPPVEPLSWPLWAAPIALLLGRRMAAARPLQEARMMGLVILAVAGRGDARLAVAAAAARRGAHARRRRADARRGGLCAAGPAVAWRQPAARRRPRRAGPADRARARR